jgi:hypothetical protein
MNEHTELELRVRVLEQMLEVTMTALLTMANHEERETVQKMLAEVGRIDPASPVVGQQCRRFVAEVALRFAREMRPVHSF